MIKNIIIINGSGDILNIELSNPLTSGFIVDNIKGLGSGTSDISMTDIVTSDGALYNSSRLPSRNIVLDLDFHHNFSAEDLRQLTYKFFPIKKKITFCIETDNRKLKIDGYVESNEPNIFSKNEGTSISILCPNPYFYSYGEKDINITVFSGVTPLFEFSFSDNASPSLIFGSIERKSENVVYYSGDIDVGVTITMHFLGLVRNITIFNIISGEKIVIDTTKLSAIIKSDIQAGDDIIICTEKGNKKISFVRDGNVTNILNCLDKKVDWFQISKGDNIFAYTADIGEDKVQFKIENSILYEGV